MKVPGKVLAVVAVAAAVAASVGGGTGPVRAATPAGPQISRGIAVSPVASSRDLRTLPREGPATSRLFPAPLSPDLRPDFGLPTFQAPTTAATGPLTPSPLPIVSFKGLDKATWGAGWPPDTVGDVGPNHFIQAVNTSIGIYSKTGTQLAAFTFNDFWPDTTTTPCDNSHAGDPTVIYDPIFDRWIVADFAFAGDGTAPPFYECIAVSQTSDPVAGGWFFYPIRTDDATHPWFADYPKMGIWPDGLYMTANMFAGLNYMGVRVWAFNRGDLESGATVRNRVVDLADTYFGLLPSNMRTAAGTPPVGRENLLVSESTGLFDFEVWKFHVDYVGAGTTFTGPTIVSQTMYTPAPDTVPSPVPANPLDSLRERLMMQAQYSNIGGAESVWVNHTVSTGALLSRPTDIQWAQINVTGGTVATTPVQEQIYGDAAGPGQLNRWMGSLAADKNGDLALGYSVSSATQNPDIRYAGRLVGDPLNTLPQTETSMLGGVTLGTQSGLCGGPCERWGDYSAMSLDPDGCTFWYTQEYYETTDLNWLTRIGSFRYPSCVPLLSTALPVAPASGSYGGTTTLSATLSQGATGIAGQTVSFLLNGTGVGSAITDASGVATLSGIGLGAFSAGSYPTAVGATYPGNSVDSGSSGSNSLTVNKAGAALTIVPASMSRAYDGSPKAATVTTSPPGLSGVSVTYNGSAVAPRNIGSYAVVASLVNANYAAPNVTGTLRIADKTPPNTKLTSGPSGRTTSRRAAFKFRSTEAGSHFQCKLDRKAWRSCRSPASYKKLKLGPHTFRVRAIDRAGNIDPTPARRSWRIRR